MLQVVLLRWSHHHIAKEKKEKKKERKKKGFNDMSTVSSFFKRHQLVTCLFLTCHQFLFHVHVKFTRPQLVTCH
jgi:hypothetical protein